MRSKCYEISITQILKRESWPTVKLGLSSSPQLLSSLVWAGVPEHHGTLILGPCVPPVFPGPMFVKPGNPGDHRTKSASLPTASVFKKRNLDLLSVDLHRS